MSKMQKIIDLLAEGLSVKEICKKARVKAGYVYTVKSQQKKKAKKKSTPPVVENVELDSNSSWDYDEEDEGFSDNMVNSPWHYRVGGIETIDFIEAKGLSYHLGNAVKYISRAPYKHQSLHDEIVDLKKAIWYIQRHIDSLEK